MLRGMSEKESMAGSGGGLPFGRLEPHAPRVFVPGDLDCGDAAQLLPLFDALEARLAVAGTVAELERWILDSGELSAAVEEEAARRYIAMTCHTDDSGAEKAYLAFVEGVEPVLKPRQFRLSELYLAHPLRGQLPMPRYEVHDRNTALHVELFREENVGLETEESRIAQQYQKASGSLTVNFRGEERTLVQMGRYLEEPDRGLRQEAWEAVARRRLAEATVFEEQFEALLEVRAKIARNAGFANYLDYAFRARGRFDYSAADCVQFHRTVETEIVPLVRELQEGRRRTLGVDPLRPWDLAVDPENRPPLKPFTDPAQLERTTQRVFDRLDAGLAGDFRLMRDRRLLDLANRKGKAPGGYQYTLAEARLPFIFMNAVGLQRDVETLLHEAGHAFHALASREEPLHGYRSAPIEFCEVASMSMELLGNAHLEEFYPPADADRARRVHLEGIVGLFPWVATVDAFQHWIYSHPGHTRAERRAAWLDLMDRFGGVPDWSGYEEARGALWHRQLHIFIHPFYYVEYGIAQLGALQVWASAQKDLPAALAAYKKGLALGGACPLPELFEAAGCRFDFSPGIVRPLIQVVRDALQGGSSAL